MLLWQLVQILYWLALSTWFGGVLFIAIAARVVFKTVRQHDPTLPTVLSVNLDNQHATLLAGAIIGDLLGVLRRIELVCAGVLLLTLIGQWIDAGSANAVLMTTNIARSALFAAAVVLVIYDWRVVWPRVWRHRQEYIDHADEPEVANPAKELFDRYHRESVTVLSIRLGTLLGLVSLSGNV